MYSEYRFWCITGIPGMVCGLLESLYCVPSESRIFCHLHPGGQKAFWHFTWYWLIAGEAKQNSFIEICFGFSPHLKLENQASQLRKVHSHELNSKKVPINHLKAQTFFYMTYFYFAIRNWVALTQMLIKYGTICCIL